jgi:integrase
MPAVPTGIRVRHRNGCPALADRDADCRCNPAYLAEVFDRRSGKKLRKTFASLSEARTWRADALVGVRRGTIKARERTTVREACEAFLAGIDTGAVRTRSGDPYRPVVRREYRRHLEQRVMPELGAVRLSDLRRGDVQTLADRLATDGLDGATIRNVLMPLRAVCRRAIEDGVLATNPTANLRLPAVRGRRDRIAGPDECERLLDALPRVDDRALWAVAMFAGLRRGELRALRWADVDLAGGVIRVERGYDDREGPQDPKSHAGRRTVPILGRLRDRLTAWKAVATRTGTDDLVFAGPGGSAFTASAVRRRAENAWTTARRKVGLEPLDPLGLHECRHTYASLLIAAGLPAKTVSTYLGHASITTTPDLYGHLMPDAHEQAVALVDAYLERSDTTGRLAQVT